jgi:hypothetical protein
MLDSAKAARTEQESAACGGAQEDLKIDETLIRTESL